MIWPFLQSRIILGKDTIPKHFQVQTSDTRWSFKWSILHTCTCMKLLFKWLLRNVTCMSITFANDFKFSKCINLSIHKVNKILGIIYQSFNCFTPTVICKLYVSLVRPHLDFTSVIWNPNLIKDIRSLEAV